MKKTVIIGASPNTDRAAYQAAVMLQQNGHEFVPVGIKPGEVLGKSIQQKSSLEGLDGVDTVTMYVRPDLQPEWYESILNLKPKRIIFNPGTENPEFEQLAASNGIEATEACSLVLLSTGQF
ncbi:MAG: CoA-binding protein [Bacteroidota bacterium]